MARGGFLEAQTAPRDTNAGILLLQICLSHREQFHPMGNMNEWWEVVRVQFEKELGRPIESPRDYLYDLINNRRWNCARRNQYRISFKHALLDQWMMRVNGICGLCPEIDEMASRYVTKFTTHHGRGFARLTNVGAYEDESIDVVRQASLPDGNPRKQKAMEAWLDDTASEPEYKKHEPWAAETYTN